MSGAQNRTVGDPLKDGRHRYMDRKRMDCMTDQQRDILRTDRPIHLESESELNELLAEQEHALVEFYTDDCGICASMEPVVGSVAKATDVAVGTVNPRDDPPLIDRFSVQSVPLFVLFRDGEPIAQLADGFVGAEVLLDWIDSNRSSPPMTRDPD